MAVLYVATILGMLAALGVFISVWSTVPQAPTNADVVEGRLRIYETGLPLTVADIELRQPFMDRVVKPALKRVGRWVEQSTPDKVRQKIAIDLQVAGHPGGMTAGDLIAVRYVLAVLLCVLGVLLGVVLQNPITLAILAAKGTLWGLYGPMIWLRLKLNGRRNEIKADLPDVIDVLVVCVEAGLTFEAAMEKVVEKYEHGLAAEFGRVMQEVRLGRQAEQLGSGISKILRIQSDEMRLRRLVTAQERGARASLKMLLPMLGCIFPTLWVILLGPAALLAMRFLAGG